MLMKFFLLPKRFYKKSADFLPLWAAAGTRPAAMFFMQKVSASVVEDRLIFHLGGESSQRLENQLLAQLVLVGVIQGRIAERVGDSHGGDNSVGADRQRDRRDRAHVHHGDTCSFDFFNHRCAATSAGPSSGGQDCSRYPCVEQALAEFLSKLLGGGDGGAVADSRVVQVVQLADDALLLQIAEHVHRQDAVGVVVGVDGVVAAMGGLIGRGGEGVHAGDQCRVSTVATENTFTTTIDSINYVSSSTGSVAYYTATAYVDVAEGIYPGMQVTVTIPKEEAADVVILREAALSFDLNNQAFVYTMNESGELETTYVKTGVSNGNYVEIRDGLKSGDTVYVAVETTTDSFSSLLSGLFGSQQFNRQQNRTRNNNTTNNNRWNNNTNNGNPGNGGFTPPSGGSGMPGGGGR